MKNFGYTLTGSLFGLLICLAVYYYTGFPVVSFSQSTGKCVKVDQIDTNYTCDNLPKRYDDQWVQ